jgi:hypothetical protein
MTDEAMAVCATCVFFRRQWEGAGYGVCRAHPPRSVAGMMGVDTYWPKVNEDDWCGEYDVAAPASSAPVGEAPR